MRFTKSTLWAAGAVLTGCVQAPPPPAQPTLPSTAEPVLAVPDPALRPAKTWDDYKVRAAKRVVQNNQAQMFTGTLPDRLRSIPVLQVQLNRDGSIRNIVVLRTPQFSPETIKMAMAAVRKAAPFEPVGSLPQPWQFNETFLYNDQLKFQLRSLVEIP